MGDSLREKWGRTPEKGKKKKSKHKKKSVINHERGKT